MTVALHWRFALWNLVFVGVALALYGIGPRLIIFSVLVLIVTAILAFRLRRQVTRPLVSLTTSVRGARTDEPVVSPIARGVEELRDLAVALADGSAQRQVRVRKLSEARMRLESVLRAMDEGVLVFDRAGRITLANAAFSRLIDGQRDPLGKTCLEVFRNEELDRAVREALDGRAVGAVEFQTGSNRVLRALVSPVSGEESVSVDRAVMVLEDLTDIRQVERIRRDFVANVSHEFKTPLTSIRGFAETILSELDDPAHQDFADRICRNARYLESLVDDLLILARIEAEPPSVLEDVDISALVNQQVSLRRNLPGGGSESISVECPTIALRADPARLSIALSNLIDNAIRYNRPSGTITLTCRPDGSDVVLEVSDQGYGIPEEEVPRIFERFYRVDKARTRNAGGTGLGLAIARHAVESQGGTLSVSTTVGSGSTFRIRLPSGFLPAGEEARVESD